MSNPETSSAPKPKRFSSTTNGRESTRARSVALGERARSVASSVAPLIALLLFFCGITPMRAGGDIPADPSTDDSSQESPQRTQRPGPGGRIYNDRIVPHWFEQNTRFWYRNELAGGRKEFVLVDVERGSRMAAFDHAKIAASLSKAAAIEYQADRLPFDSIEFTEGS